MQECGQSTISLHLLFHHVFLYSSCLECRQQCEEQKVTCSSLETALQARQAQDSLMASQLRAAQHLLQCEKLESQALSQQVSKPCLLCSPEKYTTCWPTQLLV